MQIVNPDFKGNDCEVAVAAANYEPSNKDIMQALTAMLKNIRETGRAMY